MSKDSSYPTPPLAGLILVAVIAACGGMTSDDVTASNVASVTITPPATTVTVGSQMPLQALVQDPSGRSIGGTEIFWSVQDTTIATISSVGVVTGVAPGSTQVSANVNGKSGIATITVEKTPVASVVVTPPHVDAAPGTQTPLSAVVYDAAHNPLTDRTLIWSTSNAAVATVDANGMMSAQGSGAATITATSEGKSGSATITVSQASVATVAVTPNPLSMSVGQTTQLTATLEDAMGNVLNGRAVSWSSSNPSAATVSSQGLVTAVANGVATITATSEGKSGSAAVTVVNLPVGSVTVEPPGPSVVLGSSVQLSAVVRDVSGNVVTDRAVTWSTSNPALVTISSSGIATGVAVGSATITATSEGKSGTTLVTVVPLPVGSVTVSPPTASTRVASTTTLTATVKDQSGTVVTNRVVTWTSSNTAVATVVGGVVTGVTPGVVTITATSEGKSGTATVTVAATPVASVTVQPARDTMLANATLQLTAVTKDSAGVVLTGTTVTWTTSNAAVATVSASGVVTAAPAGGNATITATSEGKSGTSAITVIVPVATVTVAPATKTILAGDTAPFTATAKDASGNVLAGRVLQWSSSNPSVASISATGTATGTGVGTTTITATAPLEGKSGSATLTVNAASISVTPSPDSTYIGQAVTLTATAKDKSGNPVPAQGVAWSSSAPSVATVTQGGVVTGVAAGSTNIVATLTGQSSQATFKVLAPVASITLSPVNPSIAKNGSVTLQATLKDASNAPIGPGRVVVWTTTDTTGTVTITPMAGMYSAMVKGKTAGTVIITATSEGKTGTTSVTVTP